MNSYLKIDQPTHSLVVVDLKNDRMDGQIAACGLQGIINRDSTEKLYITNTYCFDNLGGGKTQIQIAGRLLETLFSDIPTERLSPEANKCWPGFLAALNRFRGVVKGLIIWDPTLEGATIEAATTLAGQTDGLICSPELSEALQDFKFPLIKDFREEGFENNIECLDWLLANCFEKCATALAFTWSHMTTDSTSWGAANKDYVIASGLFSFYLDITDEVEREAYKCVLERYPPGTPILGWTDERWADALFAKLGYFMVPCISVENLSVHASFPSVHGTQADPKPAELVPNGVYIAMHVADGDNLLHSMVYEPDCIMRSRAYGEIPLTWILNPGLTDLAPRLFDWYYEGLGNQEMAAMLSDGHPFSDRYAAFRQYCDFCSYYLKKAGMLTLKQMEESEAVAWNVQPYVMNSGYAGTCPKGIRVDDYHMDNECFHIGSIKHTDAGSIRERVKNNPGEGPLFYNIFCGTAIIDLPQLVKDIAEDLWAGQAQDGVQYFFLRSMDLAATYRVYKGLPVKPRPAKA